MAMTLPRLLEIPPTGPVRASVQVPGSKSISNRAVLLAALADGDSELRGVLDSDDLTVMAKALSALGAKVSIDGDTWRVGGTGGHLAVAADGQLQVGASGTAARFVTALATLSPSAHVLDGVPRMRERPIVDLVEALRGLGADIEVRGKGGCPPLAIAGGGLRGGRVCLDASRSSQYLSAVLHVSPYAQQDVDIELKDGALVSRPYVDVTLAVMSDFGVEVDFDEAAGRFRVAAGQRYVARRFNVEPDASTAAYFFVAAAVTGGRVEVGGLSEASTQADIAVLPVLAQMGCRVENSPRGVVVEGPPGGQLRPIDIDMNAMPDAVLALAVAALFASGPSRIRNVANLRIKETDRLAALATELTRLGAHATADADSLTIQPGTLRPATVETYDDHRVAMAFALVGLRQPGVVIRDPACVSKSWPMYFDAFFAMLER